MRILIYGKDAADAVAEGARVCLGKLFFAILLEKG
jgi:hypothetical protein